MAVLRCFRPLALAVVVACLQGEAAGDSWRFPWDDYQDAEVEKPRELSDEQDSEDQSDGLCYPLFLTTFRPPTMREFDACYAQKLNSTNMSHVGAHHYISAECWCTHNMKQLIEDYHCCDHSTFKDYCAIDCDGTCDSPGAQQCLDSCPALCLESDYAPDSCDCDTHNCRKHTLCIAETGMMDTVAGDLAPICSDHSFENSLELHNYFECIQEHPMRTHWQRANGKEHCICDSNVKQALQEHVCCAADWASPLCSQDCMSEADCASQEAVDCLSQCRQHCKAIILEHVGEDCAANCLDNSSTCWKYRTCQPVEPREFEYLCDDRSAPTEDGCCRFDLGAGFYTLGCPSLCTDHRKYIMTHGLECQCFGCPTDEDAIEYAWNATVEAFYWEDGQTALMDIARRAGLELGATQEMQLMMKERNLEIRRIIEKHGAYTSYLQQEIDGIMIAWDAKILEAAKRHKECQSNPALPDCVDAAPVTAMIVLATTVQVAEVSSTTVKLADITGIQAGDSLTLTHASTSETKVVASVTTRRLSARRLLAGTVTLTSALQNSYPAGATATVTRATVQAPTPPENFQRKGKGSEGDRKREEDVLTYALLGIAALVVVFGILVMIYLIKRRAKKPAEEGGTSQITGDNVVVGRPVEGEADAAAPAGTPVQIEAGKGSDSSKAIDDPSQVQNSRV